MNLEQWLTIGNFFFFLYFSAVLVILIFRVTEVLFSILGMDLFPSPYFLFFSAYFPMVMNILYQPLESMFLNYSNIRW